MRKLVPLALMSILLAACGGEKDDGDSTQSQPRSSYSASSTPPTTPPVSSSGSSSSSAPGEDETFVGDIVRGMALYEEKACSACHGSEGITVDAGGDATFPLDAGKFTLASLTRKIHNDMPISIGTPEDCEDQCAADIAAYVITWAEIIDLSCNDENPISYSPRSLRLLTANEYQNSLQDLLGITKDYTDDIVSDDRKGQFPNNMTANVDEARANRFWQISEEIAAWAVENDQPFACDMNAFCADEFINEFAYRLFRRPLTQAEAAAYEEIFNEYPGAEGMETALIAALNAPQFLYRSEMGLPVADVLSGDAFEEEYVAVDPVSIPAGSFGSGSATDGFVRIQHYYGGQLPYEFTGNDLVRLRLRAVDPSGQSFSVRLGGGQYDFELDSPNVRTFTIPVEGLTGGHHLHIDVTGDDSGLYLGEIAIGRKELRIPSKGDEEKLALADPDAYVLTPYEMASYLSYALTGSTPDDELLEAAADGGLDYPEQVLAQVNRLLDSPAGRRQMGVFAGYWFDTDRVTDNHFNRDETEFPTYTMDVREAMAKEVRELFRTIFFDTSGEYPFETFYTGDFTMVNSVLADFYGIPSNSRSADDWQMATNLDKRGGILTSGAFMTVNAHIDKTSPIFRAVRVREQMLCQHIDEPPLLVEDRQHLLELAEEEYRQGIATSRRYFEVLTDAPSCAGCHEYQINPLFGMEDFDQVGLWRDTQKGSTGMTLDIDASGYLYGPENVTDTATSIPFHGAKELSKIIGTLQSAHSCLVEKSFRYATGMPMHPRAVDSAFEQPLTEQQRTDFACAGDKAIQAFSATDNSPRAAMTELMLQDFVRFRKAR